MPQDTWSGGATQAHVSDDVAAQLRDLERQGGGMARLAHISAGLLLVAFSAGSLISISEVAFTRFLAEWTAGRLDVPDLISLVVSVLLVLAADVALLYAASVLRVLVTSGASRGEQKLHKWAMIGASVLESSTYLYLVWSFDRPTSGFLWAIGVGRALAAPLCAAYLSLARPLPVGPRDIAYQAALAAGKGVVKDVTILAGDPAAPLERKVRIYSASAVMSPHDAQRFAGIIAAVSEPDQPPAIAAPERPPTGGGTPAVWPSGNDQDEYGPDSRELPAVRVTGNDRRTVARRRGKRLQPAALVPARKRARETGQKVSAFTLLDQHPDMTVAQLREELGCRTETAAALRSAWELEQHHSSSDNDNTDNDDERGQQLAQ